MTDPGHDARCHVFVQHDDSVVLFAKSGTGEVSTIRVVKVPRPWWMFWVPWSMVIRKRYRIDKQ